MEFRPVFTKFQLQSNHFIFARRPSKMSNVFLLSKFVRSSACRNLCRNVDFEVVNCSENDYPISSCGCILEVVENRIYNPTICYIAEYCYWIFELKQANMCKLMCFGCSGNLLRVKNIVANLCMTQPWFSEMVAFINESDFKPFLSYEHVGCVYQHEKFNTSVPEHVFPLQHITSLSTINGITNFICSKYCPSFGSFFKDIISIFNSYDGNSCFYNECTHKELFYTLKCCK